MTPFKHILVPTDFGDSAALALELAIGLASQFDSKVTLLHSNALPPLAYTSYSGLAWPIDEMLAAAEKELDATLAKAKEHYPKIEGFISMSDPTEAVLDTVKTRGVDLVVMGTHGRHGFSRVLIGSVAERIVRLSPVPVLTVSGKAEREAKEAALAQAAAKKSR